MIGVTAQDPDSLTSLPSTANSMKISPWIIANNAVYVNGNKVRNSFAITSHRISFKTSSAGEVFIVYLAIGDLVSKDTVYCVGGTKVKYQPKFHEGKLATVKDSKTNNSNFSPSSFILTN